MSIVSKVRVWIGQSLQRQFLLLVFGILTFLSFGFLALVVVQYRASILQDRARASIQLSELLEASLDDAMMRRDRPALDALIARLSDQPGVRTVSLLNKDLRVMFSNDAGQVGKRADDAELTSAMGSGVPRIEVVTPTTGGGELLRSINPVRNAAKCISCHGHVSSQPVNGLLLVDFDTVSATDNALRGGVYLAASGALVTLLTGIAIWAGLKWLVINRVRVLQGANEKLRNGDFSAKVDLGGNDEISAMGASFNNMARSLGSSNEKLHQAERFLQEVIDGVPDGIRVIDSDFNIVKANRHYCDQLGISADQVIGQKCYRSSHGRSEPCPSTLAPCPVVELQDRAQERVKTRQQHIRKDGSALHVEVTADRATLFLDGRSSICTIESIRDLSEQARLSQEQRLSEIGFLATGVAHEIHNPLSSIALALAALNEDLSSDDTASQSYIEAARAEIEKCLKVTDGLMRLSQTVGTELQLVDVGEALGSVITLVGYQAQQSRVTVGSAIAPGTRIMADDGDIRMVAINVIQNAFHAMPDGGVLTITARREDDWIAIAFTDTGIGIAPDHLKRLFLPFWTNRSDGSQGHGLGLTICKSIVERLGGTISVESEVGKGTCFTILIPDADRDVFQ
jgi:PAS domain S-box-containing protein